MKSSQLMLICACRVLLCGRTRKRDSPRCSLVVCQCLVMVLVHKTVVKRKREGREWSIKMIAFIPVAYWLSLLSHNSNNFCDCCFKYSLLLKPLELLAVLSRSCYGVNALQVLSVSHSKKGGRGELFQSSVLSQFTLCCQALSINEWRNRKNQSHTHMSK